MSQLEAMLLSLLVEVPVALIGAALLRWVPVKQLWRLALVAVAATLLSHPLAWAANTHLGGSFALRATIIEVSVTVMEAAIYAWIGGLGPLRGLAVSAVANGASFGVGLLVFYYVL